MQLGGRLGGRLARCGSTTMPLRARISARIGGGRNTATDTRERQRADGRTDGGQDDGDDDGEVLLRTRLGSRIVTLNRPGKLNTLNERMVQTAAAALLEWARSDLARQVVIEGAGERALCAGGDVAALARCCRAHEQHRGRAFFAHEYGLDHLIATYSKPVLAVMDGVTMGGGAGLALHAPFRIATERTNLAMPETRISLFPDVGASHFLPRVDANLGLYLGLTSDSLKGYDVYMAGFATHYVPSERLPACLERIHTIETGNPDHIDAAIREYEGGIPEGYAFACTSSEKPHGRIRLDGQLLGKINSIFAQQSISEIIDSLESDGSAWARDTIEKLLIRSPISQLVFIRLFFHSRKLDLSIRECFQLEYQLAAHFLDHPDFVNGVEARLMTKPPVEPKWSLPTSVLRQKDTRAYTDPFFSFSSQHGTWKPLISRSAKEDVEIEKISRARFTTYALPNEHDVMQVVTGENRDAGDFAKTHDEVLDFFVRTYNGKSGIRYKVNEILSRKCTETGGVLKWE